MVDWKWADEMTWKEFADRIQETDVAIIPVGVMEVHGLHAPLGFDNYIAEEIAKRLASRVKSLLLPVIKYGCCKIVYDATMWPGTISISPETMASLYAEIGKELARQGVRRIVFVNGHFCNTPSLDIACYRIWEQTGAACGILEHWNVVPEELMRMREKGAGMHADEAETSLLLCTAGASHVDLSKAVSNPKSTRPLPLDEMKKIRMTYGWNKNVLYESGNIGIPANASREKGEEVIQKVVEMGIKLIEGLKKSVSLPTR